MSRFARGITRILWLSDLCEMKTSFGFSHLTPQTLTNPSLVRGKWSFTVGKVWALQWHFAFACKVLQHIIIPEQLSEQNTWGTRCNCPLFWAPMWD